jgi:hypothetical protein
MILEAFIGSIWWRIAVGDEVVVLPSQTNRTKEILFTIKNIKLHQDV